MIDMIAVEKAYKAQIANCRYKVDALGNPVEMKMTLQQFADKWDQSGHWDQRGTKKGEYCMARHNDIGHYEWDNVSIILHSENIAEANKGKPRSEETKAKQSAANKGKPAHNKGKPTGKPSPLKGRSLSDEHCAKISAARKGQPSPKKGIPQSAEHNAKISAATKGRPKFKTQCPHCGVFVAGNMFKRWHGDNCKKAPV